MEKEPLADRLFTRVVFGLCLILAIVNLGRIISERLGLDPWSFISG